MYPSASALLFHVFILLFATCGLPFCFTYLYFAASQTSLVSFVIAHQDTHAQVVSWYQTTQQQSTPDTTVWTLRRVNSPPIDLKFLEEYYLVAKPTVDRTKQSISLQRSKSTNNVCFEYEARRYCSSESKISLSGIYTHAPTGDSIRITENTANVSFSSSLPSSLKESPTTTLLLLFQTFLAIAYWNARLSPSTVGLLVENVKEPWRLFTGATAHFDVWHFGMNMMTLTSLGTALEHKTIPSIMFLIINLSMILYTGILWWVFQSLLLRIRRVPAEANRPHPTVGYSGVLFAWLVVLSLEQGTVCPVFFLPQLCFSSVHIWNGVSIHPGPLIQLILMQLVLPRASWTGHLAGIVVGFVYQWRLLPVALWWPSVAIPMMHLVWCLQQKRQRFLSLRQELSSLRSSFMYMGIVHGVLWVASVLMLGGFGSTMALEYLLVLLWWYSARSDDTTMARGFILLAVLVLVTDAITAAAWMVVFQSAWTTMGPPVMVLLLRIVALLVSVVWVVHSHRLYQETPSGIFYFAFHWTVLKPSHGILLAGGATSKTSSQESSLSSWDHLGTGRRLGGTHNQEMAQLI